MHHRVLLLICLTSCLALLLVSCNKTPEFKPNITSDFAVPDSTVATLYCPMLPEGQQWELDACQAEPCMYGDVPVPGHPGWCCAEGQTYNPKEEICEGENPVCPEGMKSGKYGCYYENDLAARQGHRIRCEEGSIKDCYRYGESLYYGGQGLALDRQKGREVFEKGCLDGFVRACQALGHTHMKIHTPAPRDTNLARELAEFTCKAGSAAGCANRAYISERWDREDAEIVLARRERVCAIDPSSCYKVEAKRLVIANTPEADDALIALFKKECLANSRLSACYDFLDESRSRKKMSTRKRYAVIEQHVDEMCTGEKRWLFCKLAIQYKIWTQRDYTPERDVLEDACRDKEYGACAVLSKTLHYYYHSDDPAHVRRARQARAIEPMRQACEEAHIASECKRLAEANEEGSGVPPNYEKATSYYKMACDFLDRESCQKVAQMAQARYAKVREDVLLEEASTYYKRACDAGWYRACTSLGIMHYKYEVPNLTRKEHSARGFALHRYTCKERGDATGCYFLSGYYEHGKHVKKDLDQNRYYEGLSCQRGNMQACLTVLVNTEGDPVDMLERLIQDGEDSLETTKTRFLTDPDIYEHKRADNLISPEEKLERVLKKINAAVNRCEEYDREKEVCDYVKVRFSNIVKVAYKQYRLECEEGKAKSCYKRAQLNMFSMGSFKRNPEKFMPYLERGCELGSHESCSGLSAMLSYGYDGVKIDVSRAYRAARRAFDEELEQEEGYRYLAIKRLLGASAREGSQFDSDLADVLAHCDRESEHSTKARCTHLTHAVSKSIARQYPDALATYLKRACETWGAPDTCAMHARHLYRTDVEQASQIARRACMEGDEPDCGERGRQLMLDPERASQGLSMLEVACHDDNNGEACFLLGEHLIASEHISEQARAREAFDAGCEENHASSCYRLAGLYMGLGHVAKDEERAEGLFQKACWNYHHQSCAEWYALRDGL